MRRASAVIAAVALGLLLCLLLLRGNRESANPGPPEPSRRPPSPRIDPAPSEDPSRPNAAVVEEPTHPPGVPTASASRADVAPVVASGTRVRIAVLSPGGAPVAGALVFVTFSPESDPAAREQQQGRTGVDGSWDALLPRRSRAVECGAAAAGFLPSRGTLTEMADDGIAGEVRLQPVAKITGKLVVPDGIDPESLRVHGASCRRITSPAQRVDVSLARELGIGVSESGTVGAEASLETTWEVWSVRGDAFEGSYATDAPSKAWVVIEGAGIRPRVLSVLDSQEPLADSDLGAIVVHRADSPVRVRVVGSDGVPMPRAEVHFQLGPVPQALEVSLPVAEADADGWVSSVYLEVGEAYRVVVWPEDTKTGKGGRHSHVAEGVVVSEGATVTVRPFQEHFGR